MKEEGGLVLVKRSLGLTGLCSEILHVGYSSSFVFLVSYRQQVSKSKLVNFSVSYSSLLLCLVVPAPEF